MSDRLLSITEIAQRSGLASSALRYYERCDLITAGTKVGGRRHYPDAVLHRLSVIKACQKIGFSLAEISQLLNGNLAQDGAWRRMALTRRDQVKRQIKQLQGLIELIDCALDCDCHALCDCPHMGPGGHLAASVPDDEAHAACHAVDRWHHRN